MKNKNKSIGKKIKKGYKIYVLALVGISSLSMFTNHDPSQRVNGALFCVGGIIVMCAKAILTRIAG